MPANPTNYLSKSGMKAFVKDTSRWYASRNNELLAKVDEALTAYVNNQNAPLDVKARCINDLLMASQKWLNSKQDKVQSQQHSFRLPVLAALKDQAESEKRVITLQQLKQIRLNNEQAANIRQIQQNHHNKVVGDARQRLMPAMQTFGKLGTTGVGANPMPGKRQPGLLPGTMKSIGLKVNGLYAPPTGRPGDNYWVEAADPKHRAGYHLKEHIPAFQKSGMNNLFEYADQLVGEDMELLEKDQVFYMEDLVVRTLFEVDYEAGKLTSRMSPTLQKKVISKFKNEPEEKKEARKELFKDATQSTLDTKGWKSNGWTKYGDGWACFVMSAYGTTYIGEHVGGTFHHSSFLCGAPVLAAGMIKVVDGVPVAISEKNGHYKCDEENMRQFIYLMQDRLPGVDWSNVEYYTHGGTSMKVNQMLNGCDDQLDPKSVVDAIKQIPGAKVQKKSPEENRTSRNTQQSNTQNTVSTTLQSASPDLYANQPADYGNNPN